MNEIEKKPFRNKLMFFPKNIVKDINDKIDEGWRECEIKKYLRGNYSKQIDPIPDKTTIKFYVDHYLEEKKLKDQPKQNLLQSLKTDASLTSMEADFARNDPSKKREILEGLIFKCNYRMEKLEEFLKISDFDDNRAKYEIIILKYIGELRTIIETLAKLSGELKEEQTVVVNVVKQEMSLVFQVFSDVIKEIVPAKLEEVKKRLDQKLSTIFSTEISKQGEENQNG